MWLEAIGTALVSLYQEGKRKNRNYVRVFGVPAEFWSRDPQITEQQYHRSCSVVSFQPFFWRFPLTSADGHSARLQEAGCMEGVEHAETFGQVNASVPYFFWFIVSWILEIQPRAKHNLQQD